MRIDDIPEDELDMKTFDANKDRVVLDEIVITGEQSQGWWSSLWNSIRPLFDFFDFTGKGETQTSGIHFVSSSGGAAPTKTSALNAVETINIDDLLPAIGGANAGPYHYSNPLNLTDALSKAVDAKTKLEEERREKKNVTNFEKKVTHEIDSISYPFGLHSGYIIHSSPHQQTTKPSDTIFYQNRKVVIIYK
jgi:hypothetical protein